MIPATLIAKKRDAKPLLDEEIRFLVEGYCRGEVADYQMSALAMAICIQKMNQREIATLTDAMVHSGTCLPRCTDRPRVDKHSTGGLGDKVSLILAPLLATLDVDVPMISGRGLGLTGGTLDKLESIHGFQTEMSIEQSSELLKQVGCFMIGANEKIAPADQKLYSLRDVTGSVESVALITASILSKKIAATLDALVLDVKVGSGAFMKTMDDATELANSIIDVGKLSDLPVTVILSDMSQPLGLGVGNAIEVNESVEVLRGEGPREVRDLTIELCADVLVKVNRFENRDSAIAALVDQLDSGAAYERFEQMVSAQGGRLEFPLSLAQSHSVIAPHEGWVESVNCELIGKTIVEMKGGRSRKGDKIDHTVGMEMHLRVGDEVKVGDRIATLYCPPQQLADRLERLTNIISITEKPPQRPPLIVMRVS
ncbi:Pyrimidine-nucleoside phosphorylase [Novipirellula aureliae]|uniref:thymidine phosphorylase n=1 Tax=Novipirellula aureliae TaxID=2527966 RepID=A0A5C6E7M0_9BACT|nr:thymidine phosphorylase [Novipirellula aureliae]TWU43209.1 Pyrimidine-nucleoside phosphorylase [Novipirellula aureliae]